jgi:outer membrane protein
MVVLPKANWTREPWMRLVVWAGLLAGLIISAEVRLSAQNPSAEVKPAAGAQVLSLDKCIELALQNSHRRPMSKFALAMAEAQHRQALAGYWPQVNFKTGYQRLDEPMNFLFPGGSIPVGPQTYTIPGGAMIVTVPANAFAPGFPPTSLQMPVNFPDQTITTQGQAFTIPPQDVKVLDRNVVSGVLDMKWLLWDGGMRRGYREQSGAYVALMKETARRTDLEIVDSVKRIYWGAVLGRQLLKLGEDTLARMDTTLRLTESMYKEGAGKVTKADYLDNLIMVETVRSLVAQLDKNKVMAEAALANTMGMVWNSSVTPEAAEIPFQAMETKLDDLVGAAYQFSPDWKQLEDGIKAAEGGVRTERSGYYPKVGLTGELHRWWAGSANSGLTTPQNRAGWTLGVGLEFPVFDGFLTRNKVAEALARVQQLKSTQLLLKDGLGLQIKDLFLGLDAAAKSFEATERAMKAATENCDLNTRAYQNELVETEKVIKAQLMEALMSAQHYKARYDFVVLRSQLGLTVGTELRAQLGIKP